MKIKAISDENFLSENHILNQIWSLSHQKNQMLEYNSGGSRATAGSDPPTWKNTIKNEQF